MKLLFLFYLIFGFSLHTVGQKLNYSIKWRGDSIGYFNIYRIKTDTTVYQRIQGVTKFRVIFSFTTGYIGESYFENGILTKSKVIDTMNDDVRGSALVQWLKDQYLMVIDGETTVWNQPVTTTVGSLYYQEPRGIKEVFSERFGRYLQIENKGDGTYKLVKPDNRANIYRYENGRCTQVEIYNSLTSFSFHLISTQ